MNDDRQNDLLSAYLDGELTPGERAEVEQLLATSPAARQLLDELRALSGTLKSLPRQKLGEDLSESVLKIAKQRKKMEKKGTGTKEPVPIFSDYSEPLSKIILRRLKNRRFLVWEAVIVVVAVLLMLYNPNQPAPDAKHAQREIAMARKAEEKPLDIGHATGIQAAPSMVAADRKEEKSRGKVPADTMDESGRLESALAEKQAVPLESKLADKQPEPSSNQPTAVGMEDKARALKRAPVASDEMFVLDGNAANKEGMDLGDKTVFKKIPQAAAAKSAAPPVQEQVAGRDKAKAAPADQLLVVRCEVTPEAVSNRAFDKLLAANGIAWSDAEERNQSVENRFQAETAKSSVETKTDQPATLAEKEERSKGVRDNAPSRAGTMELVYVEAPAEQIESTLKGLSAQKNLFLAVSIGPAKDGGRFDQYVGNDNRYGGIADENWRFRDDAGNLARRGFETPSENTSAAMSGVVLGRAQRVPSSLAFDFESNESKTSDLKLYDADMGEKLSLKANTPGSMPQGGSGGSSLGSTVGGMGGGALSKSSPAPQPLKAPADALSRSMKGRGAQSRSAVGGTTPTLQVPAQVAEQEKTAQKTLESQDISSRFDNSDVATYAPSATGQMQRVLFVLQLSERKNLPGVIHGSPADVSGAEPTATETTPADAAPAEKK